MTGNLHFIFLLVIISLLLRLVFHYYLKITIVIGVICCSV